MKYKMTSGEIKILVSIVLLFLIFGVVYFTIIFNENNKKENDIIDMNKNMEIVSDYNSFFFVTKNIDNYLSNIISSNEKALYDLLDTKYIYENNIDLDNVLSHFSSYDNNASFSPKKIYYKNIDNNYVYYAIGDIIINDFTFDKIVSESFEIYLLVDYNNYTTAFYPIDTIDKRTYINDIKKIQIPVNENNKMLTVGNIDDNIMCSLYLSNFIQKLNYNIDSTYDMLDKTLKSKFDNVSDYKNYVYSNIDSLVSNVNKCAIDNSTKKKKIYVYDENNNYYIFTEESILNYNVYFEFNTKG